MNKYILYINERFPIPGVVLYAATLFWVSYSFVNLFAQRTGWSNHDFIMGFIIYFMIFLHLRIFDEHKDYSKDVIAHPERLLSRGVITLKELRRILIPVMIIEAVIAFYLGEVIFIAWLGAMIWTLLMLKEFFVPDYLNRRIGLYLVSHQLLVPFMMAIPLCLRMQKVIFQRQETINLLLLVLGAMCFTVTYELGRKTWSADRENINADSYTREWGIIKTILITLLISFSGTTVLSWIIYNYKISVIYIIINYLLFILLLVSEITFYKNQTIKNSKNIELAGAVFMLGTFINVAISFTMYL